MKPSFGRRFLVCALIFCLAFLQLKGNAQAITVRKTDVGTASEGNVLIGVTGKYENVSKDKILKRINEIRKEACKKGYVNPSTGKKLTEKDYVAIKWSSELEWIAQLRAAEATVNENHTRPNGKDPFSVQYKGQQTWAENLAWNYSGLMEGIEQWYGEKEDWVKQNAYAVTGHYESLIDPKHKYVGLGCFVRTSGGWYAIAGEFSFQDDLDETKSSLSGKKMQTMEVMSSSVGAAKVQAPSTIKLGQAKTASVVQKIKYPGIMGGENATDGTPLGKITWKSSKTSVLSIDANGKMKAKKVGKAVITAKLEDGTTVKATVTVKAK